ncbi:sugar phosphate nucleotidyltransferase [Bdellovibrionota bacterium FG-2]
MTKKQNVPVFILAGGLGTRISEETDLKPKPMVEIGEIPILVHIMRWYYAAGFDDFVICGGYRCWEIKNYFLNYEFRPNNLVIDHRNSGDVPPAAFGRNSAQEKWRVRVIDTGLNCMTGGRIARAFDLVSNEKGGDTDCSTFAVTYGDGLSDVDLVSELEFHKTHGKLGTVLGVHPAARFGEIELQAGGRVKSFAEKPQSREGYINGGFFFFRSGARKYLRAEPDCILEQGPLAKLAQDSELMMHKHDGFWQPMDTIREKQLLQGLWEKGAPWLAKA